MQIFIANEKGNVKPTSAYEAVIVKGRNLRDCIMKNIEGTPVIEMKLEASNDYHAKYISCF